MKLKDKVIIVTGGTRGIGLGCARVAGRHGAVVIISSDRPAQGESALRELGAVGGTFSFVQADVTDESQMHALIEQTVAEWGRLDCLISNAGWHPPAMTIDETSVSDFESLLRLNLTSTFMGCKFAVPHLKKSKGSIVIMSSEAGLIGQGEAVSYAASKAGQLGLMRALALDLAPSHVRVNAVCPAGVLTPLMEEWAASQYDPSAALKMVDSWHPIGRMASIEEIGEVCAFLASVEASFITGQAISPDGGATLGYRR